MPKELLLECNCEICVEDRRVEEILASKDVKEMEILIDQQRNKIAGLSDAVDYYKCIFNGSWPDAVEILERTLEKIKGKNNGRLVNKCH